MNKQLTFCFSLLALLIVVATLPAAAQVPDLQPPDDSHAELDSLRQQFKTYSGAEIVFHRDDLPEGRYHDVLKPLDESAKIEAAKLCLVEAKMYPRGFLGAVGLKSIGVFAACASKKTTDPSRPYDAQLGGYRYFGVYNGRDAVAAAFYNDGQLALTFHHECFHHIDSTVNGVTEAWQLSGDDAFYRGAISGLRPHQAPPITAEDLAALKARRIGITLKDFVSQYAAKNSREDQAETARHVMSMLPSSLVQAIEQPELPGSQRIIHVLREIEGSVPDGPGFDWFVDVALDRARRDPGPQNIDQLLKQLRDAAKAGRTGYEGVNHAPDDARQLLRHAVRLSPADCTSDQAAQVMRLSTKITEALLRQRIKPDQPQRRFNIEGQEDANGVNHTLRHDVVQFGRDAKRLKLIVSIYSPRSNTEPEDATLGLLRNLRLLARYFVYIQTHWAVTPGTEAVFESTRLTVLDSILDNAPSAIDGLRQKRLVELARHIPKDGRVQGL